MYIIKQPKFEDDSYYFVLGSNDRLNDVEDPTYLEAKQNAFLELDISTAGMEGHLYRTSFGVCEDLRGSIYTKSVELKNSGMYYKEIMDICKWSKDHNRRCVVRLADSFTDYQAINGHVSTSCLNIMHFYKNRATLFFRASDIENELLYDLHLIREFFIDRVFKTDEVFEIHVIASTAQNINMNLNDLIK